MFAEFGNACTTDASGHAAMYHQLEVADAPVAGVEGVDAVAEVFDEADWTVAGGQQDVAPRG